MKRTPCTVCQKKSDCSGMCDHWKAWFTRRWLEIQQAAIRKYSHFVDAEEKSGGDNP